VGKRLSESGVDPVQQVHHGLAESWQIRLDYVPDQIEVDFEIGVSDDISETGDFSPGCSGRERAGLAVEFLRRFAKGLQIAENRILCLQVTTELRLAGLRLFQGPVDRVKHVLQVDALVFQSGTASRKTWSFR